jgi:hypothetical protein
MGGETVVEAREAGYQRHRVGVERRTEEEGERAVESLGCYLGVAVIATVDIAGTRLEGMAGVWPRTPRPCRVVEQERIRARQFTEVLVHGDVVRSA